MSHTETHTGKIIPILVKLNETFEQYISRATGKEFKEGEYKVTDFLYEEDLYEDFTFYNGVLYKIESEEIDDDENYVKHKVNPDGSIEFQTRFYNGGTCLSEIIEEILEETNE